ncbi:Chromate resistance protein ChrB [Microbacterium sp. Se63.02b]|uniref:Chromate resistance protein ChrB n=1 Tax=Microbacterium sp. Se63.02b TaxID=2709304 RepID=UPI001604D7ED|nr:Chromate resistance protein ChrB [Microbacterium sp. Se63.02b]QNA93966.1 chromate resistance protein ChrB [Microbacterium sp. Se63.02b]
MTDSEGWLVLLVQVPATPSRHRVAVWRELRQFGAVPAGQGTWVAPDVPACAAGVERARALAQRGDGDILVLRTQTDGGDTAALRELFDAARADDWSEFVADCAKYRAEIAREIEKKKFTLAELEEEEQSLDRLQRWHRTLRSRDVFESPASKEADRELAACGADLGRFAELVYQAVHA